VGVFDDGSQEDGSNDSAAAAFDLGTRAILGKKLGLCVGFDGSAGGSSHGVSYDAEAYLAGVALRIGDASFVSVCGGAGLGGWGGVLPFGWEFPLEARAELQAGPVRVKLWGKARWVAGADARSEGSSAISFADEMSVGLSLGVGRVTHYWASTNAGHGYTLGLQYQEFLRTEMISATLGISFWGGH
jgi:hypothetical protein